jgi:hypothetical protein
MNNNPHMPHPLSLRLLPAVIANLVAAFGVLYSSTNFLTTQLRSCRKFAIVRPQVGGSGDIMSAPAVYKRGEVYFLSHGVSTTGV